MANVDEIENSMKIQTIKSRVICSGRCHQRLMIGSTAYCEGKNWLCVRCFDREIAFKKQEARIVREMKTAIDDHATIWEGRGNFRGDRVTDWLKRELGDTE